MILISSRKEGALNHIKSTMILLRHLSRKSPNNLINAVRVFLLQLTIHSGLRHMAKPFRWPQKPPENVGEVVFHIHGIPIRPIAQI